MISDSKKIYSNLLSKIFHFKKSYRPANIYCKYKYLPINIYSDYLFINFIKIIHLYE